MVLLAGNIIKEKELFVGSTLLAQTMQFKH